MGYKLKKYKNYYGLGTICAGVILLSLSFLLGWTSYNIVLIPEILLVLGGVAWHYNILKETGKYQGDSIQRDKETE